MLLTVLAATWVAPEVAFAADPPAASASDPQSIARERYRQGALAYQKGRYKDAIDLFLAADKQAPSAALSYNIARAYEKLGDDAATLRWYRDYLRRAENADDADAVRTLINTLESRLKEKGVQQLTVFSEPAGATVVIDDRPLGVTPWTGELAPGGHQIGLRLRGYADASQQVELTADDAIDVSLTLEREAPQAPAAPAAAPSPAPPAPRPERPPPQESAFPFGTVGVIVLGAGGAALGGALAFEIMRRSAEEDARQAPQVDFQDEVDAMESRKTTARVLTGVGAGLAVAGGVLLAIDLGLFSSTADGVTVTGACDTAGCGAAARGTF